MKFVKFALCVMLSAFLMALGGCGDEKTIYEDGSGSGGVGSGTTPAAFAFTNQTDAQLGAPVTSNSVTITGITEAAPISVTGGSYSIGSGAFTTAQGTIKNGQTVRVQQTASTSNSTSTTTTLTIGGYSAKFTVTTIAAGGGGGAPDGEALYKSDCSACHGSDYTSSSVRKASAASIQSAITNNVGGMGMLKALTSDQVTAIATYLAQ